MKRVVSLLAAGLLLCLLAACANAQAASGGVVPIQVRGLHNTDQLYEFTSPDDMAVIDELVRTAQPADEETIALSQAMSTHSACVFYRDGYDYAFDCNPPLLWVTNTATGETEYFELTMGQYEKVLDIYRDNGGIDG